jgi:hypothetical protein
MHVALIMITNLNEALAATSNQDYILALLSTALIRLRQTCINRQGKSCCNVGLLELVWQRSDPSTVQNWTVVNNVGVVAR